MSIQQIGLFPWGIIGTLNEICPMTCRTFPDEDGPEILKV